MSQADAWTSPAIPVCWEAGGWSQSKEWSRAFVEKTYETLADFHIDFTGWGQCSALSGGIRIQIDDSVPHTAGLGTENNGDRNGMVLNFSFANWGESCADSRNESLFCIGAIAAHEFGHVLGLAHEQNRDDTPNTCDEDPQGPDGDTPVGPWDVESIMNYCAPNWNNGGLLSIGDIAGLAYLYAPSPARGKSLFYRTTGSAIEELYWNSRSWVPPLSLTQTTGAPLAVGPPDSLYHRGQQSIFYRGSNDTIHQIWSMPNGNWAWFDMSTVAGFAPAAGNPKAAGVLDYTHVFYRGTDGHIRQLFDNTSRWVPFDLTNATGAPGAAGDPAVYVMANSVHVAYRGVDDHIHMLDWEIDRSWRHTDLTGTFGGPTALGDPDGLAVGFVQFVYYRGSDNHVRELSNTYRNGDTWVPRDLTTLTAAPLMASDPVVHNRSKFKNLFYRGSDSHIHELFNDPAVGWVRNDLTMLTGAPNAIGRPTSLVVGQTQHVFFASAGGAMQELWFTPSTPWAHFALGAALGAPGVSGPTAAHMH